MDPDITLQKRLGRACLNANRIDEALDLISAVLRHSPDDVEAHLLLGDCYLAAGDVTTARNLYNRVARLDPRNTAVRQRLALAVTERSEGSEETGEAVPTDPAALSRLLQRLTGRPEPVAEAEVAQAAQILQRILTSPNPAATVATHLDDIDALLPALLELNIRQVRTDGRPDLAEALEHLLDNIRLQLTTSVAAVQQAELRAAPPRRAPSTARPVEAAPAAAGPLRVLLLGPTTLRQAHAAEALRANAAQVEVSPRPLAGQAGRFDVVIAHHPYADPNGVSAIRAHAAVGTRVIVDLETDVEHLPPRHADYNRLGLSDQQRMQAYAAMLETAHLVTTASQAQLDNLRASKAACRLVEPLWSRATLSESINGYTPLSSLQLGWIGRQGEADDLAEIRRPLLRALELFPQTCLVIAGDPQAYQFFAGLPPERLSFLPPGGPETLGFLFNRIDVLLIPLRDTPFNRSLSDERVLDAGLRNRPWVASPIAAYAAWQAGGLLATDRDEWAEALRRVLSDASVRRSLGQAGRQKAEEREVGRAGRAWWEAVQAVCAQPPAETASNGTPAWRGWRLASGATQ